MQLTAAQVSELAAFLKTLNGPIVDSRDKAVAPAAIEGGLVP